MIPIVASTVKLCQHKTKWDRTATISPHQCEEEMMAQNHIDSSDWAWLLQQVDGWSRLRPFESEEVVALTFSALFRHIGKIRKPRHWLLVAAKRKAANYVRHCAKEIITPTDPSVIDRETGRRNSIAAPHLIEPMMHAMATLSTNQRAMLEMVDIAGMTIAEAANSLRAPYATAKSWRHRAKQRLAAHPALQALQKDQT